MGLDGEVLHPGVIGQLEGDDGREAASAALVVEVMRDGGGTRRLARERFGDGGREGGGAVVVEEVGESPELRDAGIAARGPLGEQAVGARNRLAQALARGGRPGRDLGRAERGDVGGVLDHRAGVVAADMARDFRGAIDDPHGGGIRQQRDRSVDGSVVKVVEK